MCGGYLCARVQFFFDHQLGGFLRRVVPNPGEAAAFLLAFLALLVFKLAFGIALHWFGVFMLENLPADHHTSGGVGGGGGGKSSSKGGVSGGEGGIDAANGSASSSENGGRRGGGKGGAGAGAGGEKRGHVGKESRLPPIPVSPKSPPKHRLWAPF